MKNRMFFGTSILNGFWEGLGRVLERFWDAQIHDFRAFFVVFSMQNLQDVLERQKIEKKVVRQRSGDSDEMAVARGRDREGVIRRSRPRLLKLSILGLENIWLRLGFRV